MKLLGINDISLRVDKEVLEKDKEFQKSSDKSRESLNRLSRDEITQKQKEFMKKIEPDEKVKIKKTEKAKKKSTEMITAEFLEDEIPLSEIADRRVVNQETIVSHIEKLIEEKKCPDIEYLKREIKRSEFDSILEAFEATKTKTLSPVFNYLIKKKKRTPYLKIRLVRLFL
jgi:hypothetical protein